MYSYCTYMFVCVVAENVFHQKVIIDGKVEYSNVTGLLSTGKFIVLELLLLQNIFSFSML